jgi:peptidase, S41 family
MKKKIELGTAIFFIIVGMVVACLITYLYLSNKLPSVAAKEKFYQKVNEVYKTVEQRYVGEYDENAALDTLLEGYISGVDKYSVYLNKTDYQNHKNQLDGKYSGIGITVKYVSSLGMIKVINIKDNSPAENQGVEIGDYIYSIDGKLVSDMAYSDAVAKLKAENGTTIELVLLRDDEQVNASVTVQDYQSSSIESRMLDGNIGYISISDFDTTTQADFENALNTLNNDGAQKFVFDVRNNTGGLLSSVVAILDEILPEGTLVTVKDKAGEEEVYTSDASCLEKPFAVLINESTYSGGELFAAAVRDFEAGTLVGTNTYGKGLAQEIIPLSDGTALYLSTKQYFPPNGVNYDGVGVAPDVESKLSSELEERFYELEDSEDTQLMEAIKQLN